VAAADAYAALSCCSYYSARKTLAHLPLLNQFSQQNEIVVALAEGLNAGRPPRVPALRHHSPEGDSAATLRCVFRPLLSYQ
jgi:hypothetical protein